MLGPLTEARLDACGQPAEGYPTLVQVWTGRGPVRDSVPLALASDGPLGGPGCVGGMAVEIAPVPHRSTRGEWRRLALGLLVLVPVVLLVLLPAVLGLDRYVITDDAMDGSLGRGSVVLAREVPPTDLQVGRRDHLPAARAATSDERVTRRIVAIDDGVATTEGDAAGRPTPGRCR